MKTETRAAVAAPTEVRISAKGWKRLRDGHPWVYASDVEGVAGEAAAGAAVRIVDGRGRTAGWGDYSPQSQIRLRRLSADPAERIDGDFFRRRFQAALRYRERFVRESEAYRLVSGEADGLPGLVVDRFGAAVSFQTTTRAMAARQGMLLEWLDALLHPAVLVERNDAKVRVLEGLPLESRLLRGDSAVVEVAINGLHMAFDLLGGQKTGGFLDQRENWAAAARVLPDGAEEALDVFSYQGGFALHLARVCRHVEGIDASRAALEVAEANAARNGLKNLDWTEANAFDLLKHYDQIGRKFDAIVLDPPAFAKSREALPAAERGYKEINVRALKLLKPGGILVSCSCSHHLSEEALLNLIAAAAVDTRRPVTILERRAQGLDHPVVLTIPETRYLKCIVACVG